LSGLLIGAEIGAQRDWIGSGEVAIVGDTRLAALYQKGVSAIGGKCRVVDGTEATLTGLKTARQQS
jgi:2-dehydro-3-deoxygalactonokinase